MIGDAFLAIAPEAVTDAANAQRASDLGLRLRHHRNESTDAPLITRLKSRSVCILKYAIVFLIISILAGALGLTNVSQLAKRISFILFALFLLAFLALIGFAYLVGEAMAGSALLTAAAAPVCA